MHEFEELTFPRSATRPPLAIAAAEAWAEAAAVRVDLINGQHAPRRELSVRRTARFGRYNDNNGGDGF